MHPHLPNPAQDGAKRMSKVCDAADFFEPAYLDVVRRELRQTPVLHRKQWEFGMIFLALKKTGMLEDDKAGLSMGSGKETVLYAIARQVKHLTVTDLYTDASLWECAQAANPDEFIRKNKPFPVDDGRISAKSMDMRHLAFGDCSFDFAYSSCAFEHIGEDEDFLQHLNEVYRVLKSGGVYVMTTEFTCEQETIPVPHNYIFSANHLERLFAATGFIYEDTFDARITGQSANFPMPGRVDDLSYRGDDDFRQSLTISCIVPHVQLLCGKHHVTSALFVLKKDRTHQRTKAIVFDGLADSRSFMEECISTYRTMMRRELTLYPFSFMINRKSSYYAPHAAHFGRGSGSESNSIFHTDYYWIGTGERRISICMEREGKGAESCAIELRIHEICAGKYGDAAVTHSECITIPESGRLEKTLTITADDDHAYAVLALPRKGTARFADIRIRVISALPASSQSPGHAADVHCDTIFSPANARSLCQSR